MSRAVCNRTSAASLALPSVAPAVVDKQNCSLPSRFPRALNACQSLTAGWLVFFLCLCLLAPLGLYPAHAQSDFYRGKTITYVVGSPGGDSTDLWARAVTRNMAKHIPGKPEIIVQNMPGANGLIAANYIYGGAKPDGLTMGSVSAGHYFHQLFGHKKSRFDWRKFTWIGSSSRQEYLLVVRADTPYKSIEDIRAATEPPKCSAAGPGSASHLALKILEEGFGLKLKIDTGYGAGNEQDLALERGEVQCRGIATASFGREPTQSWMKKRLIRILAQTPPRRNSRLPEVPTVYELMDRFHVPAANRRVALAMLGVDNFGNFPTVASPGIPARPTKILREAYAKALEEADLLDEARKRGWTVDHISGEELENLARGVLGQPADPEEATPGQPRWY